MTHQGLNVLEQMEQTTDLLEQYLYKTTNAFKDVRKDSFRTKVSFEDFTEHIQNHCTIVVYERTLEGDSHPTTVTGIFEVKYPIQILDTYNPFAHAMQKHQDMGTITLDMIRRFNIKGYENPGLESAATDRFMADIAWLTLINRGITYFATKKLATYAINNLMQRHLVTHDGVMALLLELQTWDSEKLWKTVEDCSPNRVKTVGVFYGNNSDFFKAEQLYNDLTAMGEECAVPKKFNQQEVLTPVDKMLIAREYSNRRINKAHRELIGVGVAELVNHDRYTKITDARISKITGLGKDMVSRKKSVRQKVAIKKLNLSRYFKTEATSTNYELLVIDHDKYATMTGSQVCADLGISKSTYTQFKKMYKAGI